MFTFFLAGTQTNRSRVTGFSVYFFWYELHYAALLVMMPRIALWRLSKPGKLVRLSKVFLVISCMQNGHGRLCYS